MRRFRVLLLFAFRVLFVTQAAMANGIDLAKQVGTPGERIAVEGHDWLTCCPRNTPVEHVELFLLADTARLHLFDVSANEDGVIRASFEVPSVRAGSYRLQVCSRGPELPGVAQGATCLPVEGTFTVLAGQVTDGGGFPLALSLAIGFGVAMACIVAGAALYRQKHTA